MSPDLAPGSSEPGLANRAAKGAVWQIASFGLSKLVVLGTTVVLARLLTPREFGLFAVALIFIAYSENLTDLGVAQALIYLPRAKRYENAALTVSILTSLALAGVVYLAASPIASFFRVDEATSLVQVLSVSLFLRGTGNLPDALLRKELRFRRRVIAEGARAVTMGVVSITLAVSDAGVWAIVWGYVAGDLAWNLISWGLSDCRPTWDFWRPDTRSVKELVSFGAPAALQQVLQSLVHDIDYLIVGRALGSVSLGYYTMAFRVPQSTIVPLFWAVSAVSFPSYAKVHDDKSRLRRGYLRQMRVLVAAGLGAGAGLAVLAPLIVDVALGPRWTPSIVVLQILAFYAALRGFTSGIVELYKGIGRPRAALALSAGRLCIVVPSVLVGLRWGIAGVAWAQTLTTLVVALTMQGMVGRTLSFSSTAQIRQLIPGLALGAGVALGASAAYLIPAPDPAQLLVGLGAGGVLGAASLWFFDRSFVTEMRGLFARQGDEQEVAL